MTNDRKAIFSTSVDTDESYSVPSFPKSSKEFNFIEECINNNFIVDFLTKEELRELIGAMLKENIPSSQTIFEEGTFDTNFYVIEEGIVNFMKNGDFIDSCSRGESFGEMALLYNNRQDLTCKAQTNVTVWKIDHLTYHRILAHRSMKKMDVITDALKKVPILKDLEKSHLIKIADALVPMTHEEGKRIIQKGDQGRFFHIVEKGTVKVHDIWHGESKYPDSLLGPGDYFGERALITGEPRGANVTAVTDSSTLCLSSDKFNELLGGLEKLMRDAVRKRILFNSPILARSKIQPHEFSMLADLFEEKVFEKGRFLMKEGEKICNQGFYIVEEGEVRIISNKCVITNLYTGDHFGGKHIREDQGKISDSTIEFMKQTTCSVLSKADIESVLGTVGRLSRQKTYRISVTLEITKRDLTICGVLGKGAFGKVSLVYHEPTKKRYAMKVISKAKIVEDDLTRAILRERNIMASINHPFIIHLINTFQDETNLYMVQNLVQGGELYDVLYPKGKEKASISDKDTQFYAACVHESLTHIHSHYIAYRDLKPENILIDEKGYCILIDFGFAKVVMDKTFTLCGTPEYIAPEVLKSKGHGIGVDNWGLGILIFELLAGQTPFYDEKISQRKMFRRILKANYGFPNHGEFSSSSKDLIQKLLMTSPSERLGGLQGGDMNIRKHVFFNNIDWKVFVEKNIKAPWVPNIKNDTKLTQDGDEDDETDDECSINAILTDSQQAAFFDFGLFMNDKEELGISTSDFGISTSDLNPDIDALFPLEESPAVSRTKSSPCTPISSSERKSIILSSENMITHPPLDVVQSFVAKTKIPELQSTLPTTAHPPSQVMESSMTKNGELAGEKKIPSSIRRLLNDIDDDEINLSVHIIENYFSISNKSLRNTKRNRSPNSFKTESTGVECLEGSQCVVHRDEVSSVVSSVGSHISKGIGYLYRKMKNCNCVQG